MKPGTVFSGVSATLPQPPGPARETSGFGRVGSCHHAGSVAELLWCPHCYEMLGKVRSRGKAPGRTQPRGSAEELMARLPASPPPYN